MIIETTITTTAIIIVTKKLGFKTKLTNQEPRWKKRIKDKINSLRKDLNRLDRWSKDELHNETSKDQLGNRYKLKGNNPKLHLDESKT